MAVRTDETKAQALSWLMTQLRWEHTLDELRHARHADAASERRAA